MNDSEPNTRAAADRALRRHRQAVETSMQRLVPKTEAHFDEHDLAAVREAQALVEDISKRHPFALNTALMFLLSDAVYALKRAEIHVKAAQR